MTTPSDEAVQAGYEALRGLGLESLGYSAVEEIVYPVLSAALPIERERWERDRLEQVGWCAQADNGDRLYTDSTESEQAATFTQGGQLFAVYRIREETPDAILPDSP